MKDKTYSPELYKKDCQDSLRDDRVQVLQRAAAQHPAKGPPDARGRGATTGEAGAPGGLGHPLSHQLTSQPQ